MCANRCFCLMLMTFDDCYAVKKYLLAESKGKYMLLLHGLRTPIATLIGLTNLYELENIDVKEIMRYVKKSISELDGAIINFIENFKK